MLDDSIIDPLVRIEDVAEHFDVSVSTVRGWIRKKLLPKDSYISIARTYRFRLKRIEAGFSNEELPDSEENLSDEKDASDQITEQLNLDFGYDDGEQQ
jgi:DNA-binding transcriptional MerR regulator